MDLEKRIEESKEKVKLMKFQEERLICEVGGRKNFKNITGELSALLKRHNIDNSPAFLEDFFDYIIKVIR